MPFRSCNYHVKLQICSKVLYCRLIFSCGTEISWWFMSTIVFFIANSSQGTQNPDPKGAIPQTTLWFSGLWFGNLFFPVFFLSLVVRSVCSVLGIHLAVVSGHLRNGLRLRLQQRLLLLDVLHPSHSLPLPQALCLRGLQLLLPLPTPLQPAGGWLLHHSGQPGCGQRKHVQEHPGACMRGMGYGRGDNNLP